MPRASSCWVLLILVLAGCRVADREGLTPLLENAPPLTYNEMLTRARGQAGAALDAFYIDAWPELEQASNRLEQSAKLLPKTTLIPESLASNLPAESESLRQDAVKLAEAARAKNGKDANEVMQRINQRIRQLRPAEKVLDEKK